MDIGRLKKNWETFGQKDPLWAILTEPDKRGGKWKKEAFFRTGERTVEALLEHVRSMGFGLRTKSALDFGCGVGRLTQALCAHFENSSGVDIAGSMIEKAREYNRFGERCRYFLNESNDLRIFENGSFDFILSLIVLQHMRPEYFKGYISEFLRVLAPGGLIVFQLPAEARKPRPRPGILRTPLAAIRGARRFLTGLYGKALGAPVMEMYGMPKEEVLEFIGKSGGKAVGVQENSWAGTEWSSYTYYVTK